MLTTWHAFMLGLIQGLTEFIPVSSSGHMKLYQFIYSLEETPLTFDIMLHVGTLIAVAVVYWRYIWDMIRHPLASDLKWLIVATIPAVAATVLFGDIVDAVSDGRYLGISFLLTCAVLLIAEAIAHVKEKHHGKVTAKDALVMGVMQALAIMPGLSRSGSTLSGGLATGMTRKRAADFAFMMSMPAILGAAVMSLKDLKDAADAASVSFGTQISVFVEQLGGINIVLVGFFTAMISGFIAIKFMLVLIQKTSLRWFSLYTGLLSGIVIIWQMLK